MTKSKIQNIFKIIGILIFLYILFKIDYHNLFKQIELLKWRLLILVVGLLVAEIIVKSLRWRSILAALDIHISKKSSINLCWLGFFVGIITPGKLGEFIKIYFLKNRGYPVFRSFFSIILDRAIDLLTILFLGLLIFLLYFKIIGFYLLIVGLILLLILAFVISVISKRSWVHKIFGQLIQTIFSINLNDYNHFTFNKLWHGIKNLKKIQIIYFFVYLVIGWLLYFTSKYVIALSLGLSLSFISIIIISVSIILITILPISIAGIGTREATVILLFNFFGLNKETAVIFSLLIFTTDIISISFGLIPYLKESSLINKTKNHESR